MRFFKPHTINFAGEKMLFLLRFNPQDKEELQSEASKLTNLYSTNTLDLNPKKIVVGELPVCFFAYLKLLGLNL